MPLRRLLVPATLALAAIGVAVLRPARLDSAPADARASASEVARIHRHFRGGPWRSCSRCHQA